MLEERNLIDGVCVVVPTYNHVNFIEECIKSILNQSYTNFDIIICDDFSTDGTIEKLKELERLDSRIQVLYSKENTGLSTNYNRGLSLCKRKYFAVVSGDDVMLPSKLEIQYQFLESNPEIGICYHDMNVIDDKSLMIDQKISDQYNSKISLDENLFFTNWFLRKKRPRLIPSSLLARSEYYLSHLFDERLKVLNEVLHGILNYGANPNLKQHFIPKVLGQYRLHGDNLHNKYSDFKFSLEENFYTYMMAYISYPKIYDLCNNRMNFILFEHLLYKWIPENEISQYLRLFRKKAGILKFIYLHILWGYFSLRKKL